MAQNQKCRVQLKEQCLYSDDAGGGGLRLDDWNDWTELAENQTSNSS